jgi:NADH dehydrogenase
MKNICVLGGSGFVGLYLCEKLMREGWSVTVLTRRRANAKAIQLLPAVTVLEVDVHDAQALSQAVAGHVAVVNLVAILHGSAAEFARAHVELVQKIVQACVANGVKQLVHVSALGADSVQPEAAPSCYLRSKGQGEQMLRVATAAGVAVTVIRPSVIFGRGDQFLSVFAKVQRIFPCMPLACAHARFQPVWVEDVATAIVRSLQKAKITQVPLHTLEACGPAVFTLRQLVQLAARLAGVNHGKGRPVIALPAWLGVVQAWMLERLPGAPLMSRDNLASMRVDNVASGTLPGLESLGIEAAAIEPIAKDYLTQDQAGQGLLGLRLEARE